MSYRSGLITGIGVTLLAAGAALASWWIVTTPKPTPKVTKPEPAASVDKKIKEDELNVITLKPEAQQALSVETSPVERKRVARDRIYAGEMVVPAGKTAPVAAPVGGILKAPKDGVPLPGQTVKKGQLIIELMPLLAPEARVTLATALVDAGGQVESARANLNGLQIALSRAKDLLKNNAGSKRSVDEAQAQVDVQKETLKAAEQRLTLLTRLSGELEKGTAAPLPIEAPEDGLLRNVSAQPGQTVPSGGALFEIVDLTQMWVRVPVYVGDVAEIACTEPASIGGLAVKPGDSGRPARCILAPPSANALAGTLDLYYSVDNPSGDLLPGQRVGVTVSLRTDAESLVLPWSAVIHDINGGTWVYEKVEERRYARRRVVVKSVIGEPGKQVAVLVSGPAPGTTVVSKGAAELYGVETGFSK
jgi:RND family efflux transporter MFP subunit